MENVLPVPGNGGALVRVNQDADAAAIGELYRLGRESMQDSVRYLIEAGKRLTEKKDTLPHGAWLPWLEANAEVLGFDDRRTASRLMKGAAKWGAGAPIEDADAIGISRQIWGHNVRGTEGTGENEWFTPLEFLNPVRDVLGAIDLDPASSIAAQEIVQAERFFTKAEDGLQQEWWGRVFLNPPYAQPLIALFVSKLCDEYNAGRVKEAILLTHNYTDTEWFHEIADNNRAMCFTRGRVKFYDGTEIAQPTQGQAFSYFGGNIDRFGEIFQRIGFIVVPWR